MLPERPLPATARATDVWGATSGHDGAARGAGERGEEDAIGRRRDLRGPHRPYGRAPAVKVLATTAGGRPATSRAGRSRGSP